MTIIRIKTVYQHFNIRLRVIKEANKVINPDYANKGYSHKF